MLLILIGPIINFFGRKFIPVVVGVIGGLIVGMIVLVICAAVGLLDYVNPTVGDSSTSTFWFFLLAIVLVLLFGIGAGIFLFKFIILGIVLLGFATGYFLGLMLYYMVFLSWVESNVLLIISTFGLGAACAIISWFTREHFLIISTSFVGAYFFVRGISLFVGGFPNEVTLYEQISEGTASFSSLFIGYLVAILVLTLSGIYYQEKKKKIEGEHYKKVA